MKKTNLQSFQDFLTKNNLTPEIVPACWPYDYNDNKGYIVTHNGSTQYFYFNDEGVLLQRKVLQDNR